MIDKEFFDEIEYADKQDRLKTQIFEDIVQAGQDQLMADEDERFVQKVRSTTLIQPLFRPPRRETWWFGTRWSKTDGGVYTRDFAQPDEGFKQSPQRFRKSSVL